MHKAFRAFSRLSLLTVFFICACTTHVKAPVDSRSKATDRTGPASYSKSSGGASSAGKNGAYHLVAKGDTLYSIAWRYGFDYRDVARWNDISSNYVIYPGQSIRLTAEPNKSKSARTVATASKNKKISTKARKSNTAKKTTTKKTTTRVKQKTQLAHKVDWHWPTSGKLVKLNTPTAKKGVDISGKAGQKIKAAAAGDVVYSGGGLLGYGKLIIIKHNDTFLSAYAHNDKLYAKEGDKVKAGEKIATMGLRNKGRPILHFEIRKNGSPVNPLLHLPKRSS
jgi:lipoprotein NlpD